MSSENDFFDNFLKDRFEHKTFEQKDHYWIKAQQLIRKSRRQKYRIYMGGAAVVIVGVLTLIYPAIKQPLQSTMTETPALPSSVPENTGHTKEITVHSTPGLVTENKKETTEASSIKPSERIIPTAANKNTVTKTVQAKGSNKVHSSVYPGTSEEPVIAESAVVYADKPASPDEQAAVIEPAAPVISADVNTADPAQGSPGMQKEEIRPVEAIESRLYKPVTSIPSPEAGAVNINLTPYEKKRNSFLTAEGGTNFYHYSRAGLSSLNLHLGLRYYHFISSGIGVSAGFGYSRLHQDAGERTYRSEQYGFDAQVKETKLITTRLDYAELPLAFYIKLSGKHFVHAGISFNYLIQSAEIVEVNDNGNFSRKADEGHKAAFNTVDMQMSGGYYVLLNERFNFNAGYYFGLTDISRNDIFRNTRYDRNSGLRLTLGLKLY